MNKISDAYLDQAFLGLQKLKFDVWYSVKSEEQKQAIIYLITGAWINDVEFSNDYSKIRRVDLNFTIKQLDRGKFYERNTGN